jgi:hypothetical protein
MGAYCHASDAAISKYPLSSVIVGFSLFYILVPMLTLTGGVINKALIFILLLFVYMDVMFLVKNRCTSMRNLPSPMSIFVPIAISYGLGGFVAYLFVLLVTSTEHTELLYFGTEGSGPLCKLSRNKKMRCSVYKNGELITTH